MARSAKDPIRTAEELQTLIEEGIPMVRSMGVEVREFDGSRLRLRAPLAPNSNVHGTGFAGSVYAMGALAGWGLVTLQLGLREIRADIVVAHANVRYLRPVDGDLEASCGLDEAQLDEALARLERRGMARFTLTTVIGPADAPQANVEGHYAVRRLSDQ